MGTALLWVAWWNGFPILFGDSGGYLRTASTGQVYAFRPSGYPLLLTLARLGSSVWPVAVVQAAILAYLLSRMLVLDLGLAVAPLIATGLAIATVTTLAWWTVTVMSDVWIGIVALALYLLLYHRPALFRWERVWLGILLLFSLSFHMSYVPIAILALLLLLALHSCGRSRLEPSRRLSLQIGASLLAAGLFFPVANLVTRRGFSPSIGGEALVLARFAADGLLVGFLRERCGDDSYVLCSEIDALAEFTNRPPPTLPRNEWPCPCSEEGYVNYVLLWDENSPLRRAFEAGETAGLRRLLFASVRHDPLGHLRAVASGTRDLYFDAGLSGFIDGNPELGRFLRAFPPPISEPFESVARRTAHYVRRPSTGSSSRWSLAEPCCASACC